MWVWWARWVKQLGCSAYAERLREAGCDVVLKRYDGVIHGFSRRLNQLEKARQALFDSAGQMNRVLRNS